MKQNMYFKAFYFKMAVVFHGLICILLIACVYGDTLCPSGWLASDSGCYLFAHYNMPYAESKSYCEQHHGRLLEVHNINVNAFIKDHLGMLNTRHWWLGMTDRTTAGVWQWETSHNVANYTDWYPGHPSSRGDYCAYFSYSVGYKWATTACTGTTLAPICEREGYMCVPALEVIG